MSFINGCSNQPALPPAINSFTVSPTSINQGEKTTISWDVSGATAIDIQPAIGKVGPSGSLELIPSSSVTYTIIASNDADTVSNSVALTVKPLEVRKADLVVTDVWLESLRIYYKIKNQGDADSAGSRSYLYVNGQKQASDWVEPLAAGEEITTSFSNFVASYYRIMRLDLGVCADVDNAINENSEENNCTEKPIFW